MQHYLDMLKDELAMKSFGENRIKTVALITIALELNKISGLLEKKEKENE